MERDLRLGPDRGSKLFHKQGIAYRETRGLPLATGRAGPVFVTAPPVPDQRPITQRTGTVSADSKNGAQRRTKPDGTKIWFVVPSSFEGEKMKQEQMKRLMPELKAQLQTEMFGLHKAGADLVAPRFKEGSDPRLSGSEPQTHKPIGVVKHESDDDLRVIVKALVGVVSWLVAGMVDSREALSDRRRGLEPVGTGGESR